ncbi:MAG: CoA transferase [Chloroflexi bacterium]|nr:CoA transferase [Chloroflexota bacterium]
MADVLAGIRVLDFTIWLFGPSCTQVLGDFGAEVIKVEPPGGEPGRSVGLGRATAHGVDTHFLARNRNKQSICVDLRRPASRPILARLVATCDVAVQNYRPGVAERLGLTYEELARINPRLIYAAGSGYGLTGPYAGRGGQDRAAQAISGLMSASGDPEWPPVPMQASIIDFMGGMLLVQGVLLALLAREQTGKGQRVDVSLLESAMAAAIEPCTHYLNTGEVLGKRVDPMYEVYQTSDSYVQLVTTFVRGGKPLPLLCGVLEIEDLSQDPRFATPAAMQEHARELRAVLQAAFRRRTTAEWVQRLNEKDIIGAPVYNYREVFQDPQVRHNGPVIAVEHPEIGTVKLLDNPVKLSETPGQIRRPPPAVGQHTDDVLAGLGFSAEEIAAFRAEGVVAQAASREVEPPRRQGRQERRQEENSNELGGTLSC